MQITKLVIGIISLVLSAFIIFQSCAAGLANTLGETGEISGSAGFFLSFCMIVAGIIGIATRKSKKGGFVAGGFYILGGLIGIAFYGSFSDLMIWSVLCFIFAIVFIVISIKMKKITIEKPKAE